MKTKFKKSCLHEDFAIHVSIYSRILTFFAYEGPAGFSGDERGRGDSTALGGFTAK